MFLWSRKNSQQKFFYCRVKIATAFLISSCLLHFDHLLCSRLSTDTLDPIKTARQQVHAANLFL